MPDDHGRRDEDAEARGRRKASRPGSEVVAVLMS